MFSNEVCKISKNTFFTEHIWATASAYAMNLLLFLILEKCEYDSCFNVLQEHDNNIFKEC